MKTLEFIFDFASPNAYMSWKVLPEILQRTGAELKIMPALLGGIFKLTGNQAPMIAFGGVKGKLEYDRIEIQRFLKRHALAAFRMNPKCTINTITLMRGLIAAEDAGVAEAYIAAVMAGMWEDEKNMGDPAVLAETLAAAGLDAEAILAATQDQAVKDKLAANTDAAVARGVFGIPTFFIGDEMFFGKDRLQQVEEALAAS